MFQDGKFEFEKFPWCQQYDRSEDYIFAEKWVEENVPLRLTLADLLMYAYRAEENAFKLCFCIVSHVGRVDEAIMTLTSVLRVNKFLACIEPIKNARSLSALAVM